MKKTDLAGLLAGFKKNKQEAKLQYYRPFTEDDVHFGDVHEDCEYADRHRIDVEKLVTDESEYWGKSPDTQSSFHRSHNVNRAILAGNRAGKTISGAAEAACMALGPDGERFFDNFPEKARGKYMQIQTPNSGWVVSRTYDVQEEGAQYWLLDKGLIPKQFIDSTKMHHGDAYKSIELTNGSKMTFKSSESEREAFQAAEKRWIWFDEEPKDEGTYNECTFRKSGSYPLDIWFTLTPVKGMTFIYPRVYEADKFDIFQWSLWDNPYFPNDKVAEMEGSEEITISEVKKRIYGLFLKEQTLIFPMFEPDRHVKETFEVPASWTIIEVIDPGFKHPAAVSYFAINPQNVIYVVDEIYETNLTTPELAQRIHEKRDNATCSATGRWDPRYSLIDPQANQTNSQTEMTDRQMLASPKPEHGPQVFTKPAKRTSEGLDTVRSWLRPGEKGPRFFVMEHCKNYITEMKAYKTEDEESEKPLKKDDHLMNTTTYLANEKIQYIPPGRTVTTREGAATKTNPRGRSGVAL